jgi:hypothetical protein
LAQWLRTEQQANHIAYVGEQPIVEVELKEEQQQRQLFRDQLLFKASQLWLRFFGTDKHCTYALLLAILCGTEQ